MTPAKDNGARARAPTTARARRVLLVGMMGAGKTTIGRLLATRLGWGYLDSDEEVERTTGRSVKELFATGGEQGFRAFETHALALALSRDDPVVVSVAGGAVLEQENRKLLTRSGTVVWLRAEPATLLQRITAQRSGATGSTDHRPLLDPDPAQALETLDRVRRPLYEEVAHVVVDVDVLEPAAVVDAVCGALA